MQVLIFEDEQPTAERLIQLLSRYDQSIKVLDIIPSIDAGLKWFENNEMPDLVFMDVQLSDGNCFELFEQVNISAPIIFTTAFDQYAIKAFKVNSVYYLVKPVVFSELKTAMDKFNNLNSVPIEQDFYSKIQKDLKSDYKQRFLIRYGDKFNQIPVSEIAYFKFEDGLVIITTKENKEFPINNTIDTVADTLNPASFFRINRKFIINIDSIVQIHTYFNGRLKLELKPEPEEDIIVSRERVISFKEWLNL